MVARGERLLISALFAWDETSGTPVLLAAGDQALLRVVRDVCGNDGMDATYVPVGASHEHSILSCGYKCSGHLCHASVEEPIQGF